MPVNKKVKPYGIWQNAYHMTTDTLDVVVTIDVGPRIIYFALNGQSNHMVELFSVAEFNQPDAWHLRGGHRFWHAPEAIPRTYYPDNNPVTATDMGAFVRFIQPVEETTGLQKEIDMYAADGQNWIKVVHRLKNTTMWPLSLAPWALSVMAQGGRAIVPLPPRQPHSENVLPVSTISLWSYTDFTDPRWLLGQRYVMLQQDPQNAVYQKIGLHSPQGWAAYWRAGQLFLKLVSYDQNADYPDLHSTIELFTNADMLEVETLAPYQQVPSGGSVEHVEHWFAFDAIPAIKTEDDADQHLLPLVEQAQASIVNG